MQDSIAPYRISIETPEQVALEFPIASIGSRCLALMLDSLLQGAAAVAALLLFALLNTIPWWNALPGLRLSRTWGLALLVLFAYLLYSGYFAIFEIVWRGQTPGKRALRIRVVRDDGRAPGAFGALTRNLVRAVDALPVGYAVGVVCMALNGKAKRLGDYAAGTLVVHEREQALWTTPPAEEKPAPLNAGSLPESDLELIETFLHRRLELAPETRLAMARKIALHLETGLGIESNQHGHDEDFLATVAAQMREARRYRP